MLLYVNAYLVGQVYGGPEEGGWYYNAWTPLASIPIPTKREVGKSYILNTVDDKTTITVIPCGICGGTGEVDTCDDEKAANPEYYRVACCNENQCSYLPEDLDAACKTVDSLTEMFKDESIRHEYVRVSLEHKFAEAGNNYAPYE